MSNLPADIEQGDINVPDMRLSSVLTLKNRSGRFAPPEMPQRSMGDAKAGHEKESDEWNCGISSD